MFFLRGINIYGTERFFYGKLLLQDIASTDKKHLYVTHNVASAANKHQWRRALFQRRINICGTQRCFYSKYGSVAQNVAYTTNQHLI